MEQIHGRTSRCPKSVQHKSSVWFSLRPSVPFGLHGSSMDKCMDQQSSGCVNVYEVAFKCFVVKTLITREVTA